MEVVGYHIVGRDGRTLPIPDDGELIMNGQLRKDLSGIEYSIRYVPWA